jgi:hypothetical protein
MDNCCDCGEKTDEYLETEKCVECYVNGLITCIGVSEQTELETAN